MKNLKFLIAALICAVLMITHTAAAYAKEIGVVDLTKVLENYTLAQEVSADLNVKKAELEKFVVDAQEKIKNSTSPLEKKNTEEKLSEQFNINPDLGAFGGWWITNDYKNTILNRLMRFKFVYVLQNHYRLHNVIHWHKGKRGEQLGFLPHYELNYDPKNWVDEIKNLW